MVKSRRVLKATKRKETPQTQGNPLWATSGFICINLVCQEEVSQCSQSAQKKSDNQEYNTHHSLPSQMKVDIPRQTKAEGVYHNKTWFTRSAEERTPS